MDDDSAAVTAPLALPSEYAFGWHDSDEAGRDALRGLSEDVVRNISALKDEPEWMLNMRLKALRLFYKKPMPAWGADLSGIDFDRIKYFVQSTEKKATSWEELPEDIKNTYDRLGIPEAEKQRLVAGVSAQYESTSVYNSIREDLEKLGVIFMDTDTALREHEDLVRKYFATVIPPGDNKFAALNTAVWSGGSFVYIPPGVKVDIPLQAYFRINTESMGQFERTLIIADKDSSVHYVEGCLLKDGLIDMYDGSTKEMGDIVLGDKVYSSDGEPAVVTDTMVRPFEGLTYILATGSPGNSIEVTGEHPVMVIKRSRAQEKGKKSSPTVSGTPALRQVRSAKLKALTPEWVPAKDVDVGDFLVLPVEKRDESVEDLPVSLGKLAGYFLAEGSASLANGFPCLTFSLHEDETHLAEDIQELCLELYGARGSVTHVPKKHTITVSVFTKEGHAFMKENIGTRSYNKKLSPLLFHQRLEFTDAVVEGYMLGDGNIAATSETMTRVRASTVSKDWAFQLQKLVARQGYFASIRLERPSGSGVIMGCRIMRRYLWRVLWNSYSTEKRGSNPVRLSDAGFLVPVKSVTKSQYSGDVYNFETSPSHTYTSNAVLVHNCTAPIYDESSLHSAVVEIVLLPGATCRYTTIQNWSDNVYNLVTKRALAQAGATMEWIDANIGCVASGAVVSTPSGPRVIEALRPGDLVSSLNQATGEFEYKKVTAVINNGSRPTIEVSSSGNSIRVTEEHPFLASRPSKKNGVSLGLSWLPATATAGQVVVPVFAQGAGTAGLPSGLAFSDVRVDLVPVLAETWDIEVEDNENFVCNGFVVHNSKVTMKYPAVWMTGEYARGETLSIALAGHGQHQDAGSKMVHAAPNTSSAVVSKSVARAGGRTSYRGLVQILPGATNSKSTVRCDALLIDDDSRSDTYPYVDVREDNVSMGHEATVSKVSADQLFYLMTRGLTEAEAMAMIVRGFIEPIAKELPMEYALELNRLIELQMDGSVG